MNSVGLAQGKERSVDLVAKFKRGVTAVAGEWSKDDSGIRVAAGAAARAVLAEDVSNNYSVEVELTRERGNEVVALILPVGPTSVALELSGWGGESHGLARIDGRPTRSENNPTSVRPGKIQNGERQKLSVKVSVEQDTSQIAAQLNGKNLIDWDGPLARLQPHFVFNLPKRGSLGIASKENDVVFHRIVLTTSSESSPSPIPVKESSNQGLLANLTKPETPGWSPFNEAEFSASGKAGTISAIPGAGSGDRGAYLDGLEFDNGTIEIELKGDARPQQSFIGVVFGGVDGEIYESVYFRPFNFGVADSVRRSHAVQYICHPKWPWKRLRDERSGEFEKLVSPEPKPAEWFKARIEVSDADVRVFTNGGSIPSLQVKRLTDRRKGKVGLWFNGIASFRNLQITQPN